MSNADDAGPGSLRQAIVDANSTPAADVINFEIAGDLNQVHVIALSSPLDAITAPLTLDGYSQAGARANTSAIGSNAALRIALDGGALPVGAAGLRIGGSTVVVRGLAIGGVAGGAAIAIDSGVGARVEGCFLGTDAAGMAARPNLEGVFVAASNFRIGGTNLAQRNVIAGNLGHGLRITSPAANGGIWGNRIGVDASEMALGNGGDGVRFDGASAIALGDTALGRGNVIANNAGAGAAVLGESAGISIVSNSFFANGGLGIDLGGDGVTFDDALDSDAGPNGLMNAPLIASVTYDGARTRVTGSFFGAPSAAIRVQLFSTGGASDPSGRGEGRTLLADGAIQTDSNGAGAFALEFDGLLADGDAFTATATDGAGNTSEFSAVIAPKSDIGVTMQASSVSVLAGQTLTYTISVTNHGPTPVGLVTLRDELPAHADLVGINAGPFDWSIANGSVTVLITDMAVGAVGVVTITVAPRGSAPATIINRVSALGSRPDPVASNNLAQVSTTVVANADLAVAVGAISPSPATAGVDASYVITVTNQGPSRATAVAVQSPVPVDSGFVGVTASQGSAGFDSGMIVATIDELEVGASVTVVVTIRPTDDAIGSMIAGSATVIGAEVDLDVTDNSAQGSPVPVVKGADLEVWFGASTGPALLGQTFTQAIHVRNSGPHAATNAVLRYTIPTGATLVSREFSDASAVITMNGSTIRVSIGALESGGAGTLLVQLSPLVVGSLQGSAVVTNAQHDPASANNTAVGPVVVVPASDLQVSLAIADQAVLLGETVQIDVRVDAAGPSSAGPVTIELDVPGMMILAADASAGVVTIASGRVLVALDQLEAGGFTTLHVQALTLSAGVKLVTARAFASTADPNHADNVVVGEVDVTAHADLAVEARVLPRADMPEGLIGVGQTITYALRVRNLGPNDTQGVVLTNVLPASVTLISVTTPTSSYTVENGAIVVDLGPLASGELRDVVIVGRTTAEGLITNTTTVRSDMFDGNGSNSEAVESVSQVVRVGAFRFVRDGYSVQEDAGQITVTVERVDGERGRARVGYTTMPDNASMGFDYTPVAGTLVFEDGVTSQTFSVPVLDDATAEQDEAFVLILFDPSEGAVLGAPHTSVVTIAANDPEPPPPPPVPDVTPPRVAYMERSGSGGRQTARLIVHFDEAISHAVATDSRAYRLWSAGRDRKLGTRDDVLVPIYPPLYDKSTNAVLVRTFRPLASSTTYRFVVSGTGVFAIRDGAGNKLDGDRDGVAGGDFVAQIGKSTRPTRARNRSKR